MINYAQEGSKTIMVCIDSYDCGVPKGRFYNTHLPSEVKFQCLTEFIKRMEETLDFIDGLAPTECTGGQFFTENYTAGEKATLSIRILFRQNGSWQGLLTWLDKRREYSFKSALELVLILGDAFVGNG